MGAVMYSNKNENVESIHTKAECYTVSDWIHSVWKDDRPMDDWIGSWEFPVEACQKANEAVPMDYEEAKAQNLAGEHRGTANSKETFESARSFLKYAAESDDGINGSF